MSEASGIIALEAVTIVLLLWILFWILVGLRG